MAREEFGERFMTSVRPTAWQSGDDVARYAAYGVFAVLAALVLATFRHYGISWDEEVQNTYGNELLAFYASGFSDTDAFSYKNLFFYGGFFDIIAGLANKISPFGVYETRHLVGGALALAGYVGAWRLACLLAGARAGLIALLLLACTPLLYGHGFINPKDAPFAWLTTWTAYFACRAIGEAPAIRPATIIGFGLALGAALGTRVMAGAWLVYLGAVLLLGAVLASPRGWLTEAWARARPLLWAAPLSVAAMALFWPWSVMAPFNIGEAAEEFTQFPWKAPILWNGRMVLSTDLPVAYLPVMLGVQLPETILFGLGAAVAASVVALRSGGWRILSEVRSQQILYVTLAAVVPIAACIALRPTLYNGMRHFLFVVPPLGILAALGLNWALARLHARHAIAAMLVLLGLLGRQAWIARSLHPDEYVYYNAIAGDLEGADGRFELDYWGTSMVELSRMVRTIVAREPAPAHPIKVAVCANPLSAMAFLPAPFVHTWDRAKADIYLALNSPACADAFERGGREMAQVTRRGVVLSRAIDRRPTAPPPDAPATEDAIP